MAAGVVVVGGAGGGFFSVAGSGAAPVAVAAGTTVTAGSSSEGDNPDNPEPSSEPPASSEPPTSTEEPTSTEPTSSAPTGPPTPCLIFPKDGATSQDNTDFIALLDKELGKGNYRETTDTVQLFVSANITAAQNATLSADAVVSIISC